MKNKSKCTVYYQLEAPIQECIMYKYMYMQIHVHAHVFACTCTCTCMYMYLHVHVLACTCISLLYFLVIAFSMTSLDSVSSHTSR